MTQVQEMAAIETFVLPGMDGTTKLLRKFCELAPDSHNVAAVALPPRVMSGFQSLASHVAEMLPRNDKVLLVAESFSGPIAVNVAAHHPERVIGLVLVATFVDSPVPAVARIVPWTLIFRCPLPKFAARIALVGNESSTDDIHEIQDVARAVSPEVVAGRLKMLMTLDETASLKKCKCPLLYIRPTADRLVPERCWETIRDLRPDARLAEIDGPHFILQRKPTEAWQHIAEFSLEII